MTEFPWSQTTVTSRALSASGVAWREVGADGGDDGYGGVVAS